ncbi:hypothetical protein SODALDRAFT_354483 [Sodiomyces alkalinus F11]|uniref:DNA polymerase delta subunit 4 n=1 Tax=Sodiomyces alkalinus (strain CBS 110278 / VKM F-3762 / F11) TaxID=1314773 RepID=A0A3N2Q6Q9_SODAK|nr:hypothetical protein SODALDRAFT_354483 [Sodiomyces alkalinus F11]ROT42348.1 hypothetical protein SODALDRAFT_354483 [Sodiomyces alkalinus F11]
MPTTRRATGGARAQHGPGKGQSTLSFSNRVSKSVSRQDAKKPVVSPITEKDAEEDVPEVTKVEVEPEETLEVEQKETKEETEEEAVEEEQVPTKSEAELRAEKISDAQIAKYWKNVQAQSIAPQVHVEDVSLGEKILRHFDVSLHYGPCVGIQRQKRWERAEKLGLNPPIEVLAVLLKQESPGKQQAHMDELLNSTAVGA